jgi:hypothetical protein
VTCPIEIECKTSEADNCCEGQYSFDWNIYFYLSKSNLDEQGTPFCCGGPIPEEYVSPYGGYGDDTYGTAESINKMYNHLLQNGTKE